MPLLLPLSHPRPLKRLVIRQSRQHPKHHRDARIQLDPHQAMRDGIGDVLEVHGRAFDQDAYGYDGGECGGGR